MLDDDEGAGTVHWRVVADAGTGWGGLRGLICAIVTASFSGDRYGGIKMWIASSLYKDYTLVPVPIPVALPSPFH